MLRPAQLGTISRGGRALRVSDLPLSLRVSGLPPHTPTPPATFQPPRENKSRPQPRRPHFWLPPNSGSSPFPACVLPQSDPKLSKWPLSICSDGQGSGTLAVVPTAGDTRRHAEPRTAPCPRPGSRERCPRSPAARLSPTWPGHSAPSPPAGAAPLPAASPAPGPRRAGARPPALDPLGPNARATVRAAAPAPGGGPGVGGARGAIVESAQHSYCAERLLLVSASLLAGSL